MSEYTAYFNGEWVPTSEATLSPWAEEFLAANVEEAKAPSAWVRPVKMPTSLLIAR